MTLSATPHMTPVRTTVFAVAAGLAVGNLYWAQPLIEVIAGTFGVSSPAAAALVTVTQVGYAAGIFLLVPLGDVLNRRRLVPLMLLLSAGMLLAAAASPGYPVLFAALGGLGMTTVGAQLLTPLASELAAPDRRGSVVGTVASGVLVGILLSRTVSGVVADLFGWRAIFLLAAGATVVAAAVLHGIIPALAPREPIPYPRLLRSVFTTVGQLRAAPPTLLISAAGFAVFSLFWTSLTFLLTAPPFGYSVTRIGLVGLAGLAGALAARQAGALHDRGRSVAATGAALALLALSLTIAWAGQDSIIVLIVAVVLLDVAVQAVLLLGQTRLFALAGPARSRVNTAVVVSNFLGGAVGSAVAGPLWAAGGWAAIMSAAIGVTLTALLLWATTRRRLATTGTPADGVERD
ncbi:MULTISPECIES: MFS transporter [Catenuloplanes]|uniref:MFS family arabinose efflux permease n=1 Tax=Catenuloplanes niger TaxID=587534 RepID=A0AAE3ZZI9_9ACTN|nr:MFS transporter [Catenuloplanes niger]MDR7327696.1 putative MFS family arabinose efflux permease [Catenuloplanes niger]